MTFYLIYLGRGFDSRHLHQLFNFMQKLFESWKNFLAEEIIKSTSNIIDYIKKDPNQNINIDSPRGSVKGFGGANVKLPFDYGEWPHLMNPADNMGWDLIIVPSASKNDKNLVPVGYLKYVSELKPDKVGNDKIIIAPNGQYSLKDKKTIDSFFDSIEHFESVKWLKEK